ncbi:RNA-directed DNA polymerase, partial [uncultured Aquimarina sp.]|uniref:RNA-directed DNA polymerase n=1 Tax=uncultured Aquimarina sp. TaxID=575652 RepID=UPI00261BAED7
NTLSSLTLRKRFNQRRYRSSYTYCYLQAEKTTEIRMEEKKILESGYFPKELPPAFLTKDLADNIDEIRNRWNTFFVAETTKKTTENRREFKDRKDLVYAKYSSSKCVEYSISKGKLARRVLKIPNPKHFISVSHLLNQKWSELNTIFTTSEYSTSYPIEETNPKKRAVRTFSKSVQDLRNTILETSVNKLYQVKLDISKFYPTIYTHVISWSLLGKEIAKEYYKKSKTELETLIASGDANAILYKYADSLDSAVRACQDKQSVGIPIGPDTSHIISEVIACRIDIELKNKFSSIDIKACRYYDDYYVYVDSLDQADAVIKGLQIILNQFQLEINDKKVEVKEFPVTFENNWVTDLHRFEFKSTNASNSIKHYFSLLWGIGEKNYSRTDWIFKYSLRTFEFGTTNIPKDSWEIFENLILKTGLIQPAILDIVTRIFLKYESFLNPNSKIKIKNLVDKVIKNHSSINHNFETAWALWFAKSFDIQLDEGIANLVIDTNDSISILILLCMDKEKGLIDGNPNYSLIENNLKEDILFSESWLLAYQGVKNGWLTPIESDLISKNEFMKIMLDLDVNFFDCSLQLEVYGKSESKEETQDYSATESNSEENKTESELETISMVAPVSNLME